MLIQTQYLDGLISSNGNDLEVFSEGLNKCQETRFGGQVQQWTKDRENPRWNPISGQQRPILIQNATLFDGESVLAEAVDITFKAGVISSVSPTTFEHQVSKDIEVINASGRPGSADLLSIMARDGNCAPDL